MLPYPTLDSCVPKLNSAWTQLPNTTFIATKLLLENFAPPSSGYNHVVLIAVLVFPVPDRNIRVKELRGHIPIESVPMGKHLNLVLLNSEVPKSVQTEIEMHEALTAFFLTRHFDLEDSVHLIVSKSHLNSRFSSLKHACL